MTQIESLNTFVKIPKITKIRNKTLILPSSKALSIRGLYLPFLGIKIVVLKNIPNSDDFNINLKVIKMLGIRVIKLKSRLYLMNNFNSLSSKFCLLDVGNSGLGARFLITFLSLMRAQARIITGNQLVRRPLLQDCEHLVNMGVRLKLDGNILNIDSSKSKITSKVVIKTSVTSQYLSAMLFFGWKFGVKKIKVDSKVISFSYVKTTLKLLERVGIKWQILNNVFVLRKFKVKKEVDIFLPPDASIASNFLVLSCILKHPVKVKNFKYSSIEPDYCILNILKKIGANYKFIKNDLAFFGDIKKVYMEIDLKDNPDLLPILAILLLFLKKGGKLKNIFHTRFKESPRSEVLIKELSKLEIKLRESNYSLQIPGTFYKTTTYLSSVLPSNLTLDCYNDHRVFMAFAILACVIGNINIKNHNSLSKSFPDFLKHLY